jgi:hypothetical protein
MSGAVRSVFCGAGLAAAASAVRAKSSGAVVIHLQRHLFAPSSGLLGVARQLYTGSGDPLQRCYCFALFALSLLGCSRFQHGAKPAAFHRQARLLEKILHPYRNGRPGAGIHIASERLGYR